MRKSYDVLDREIEYVKEQTAPTYADLKAVEKWVHLYANILKNGRTEHVVPPGAADPEAALEKEKEGEPYIDRLRPISEDESNPLIPNALDRVRSL